MPSDTSLTAAPRPFDPAGECTPCWGLPAACNAVVKGGRCAFKRPYRKVLVHVHETKMRISGQTARRKLAYLRGANLLTILARASRVWPSSRGRRQITKRA